LLGALAGVAASQIAGAGWVRRVEFMAYDRLSALCAEPALAASSRVQLVLMDAGDPADPIAPPRSRWGELIELLARRRPKAIVLDLLMADPSPHGEPDDRSLAARLLSAGRVILPAGNGRHPVLAAGGSGIPAGSAVPVYGRTEFLQGVASLLLPERRLVEAALRVGVASIRPDGTGGQVVRRVPVAFAVAGEFVPSLPVAAVMTAFDESSLNIAGAGRLLQGFAGLDLPLDPEANLLLNFRGPRGSFRAISAASLSAAMLDPGSARRALRRIKPRDILVLGLNPSGSPGREDEHATPTDPAMPGPEVLATAIDNLIRGDVRRMAAPALLRLLPVLFGCAVGFLLTFSRRRLGRLLAAALLPLYLAGAAWLFREGFVLEFVTPPLSGLLAVLAVVCLTRKPEEAEQAAA